MEGMQSDLTVLFPCYPCWMRRFGTFGIFSGQRLPHLWWLCKASICAVARGEPFLADVWIKICGVHLGDICSNQSYQHITNRQQHQHVTITAGKWKVLWGKQTPLRHTAGWSTRWTQMSENIDSDGQLYVCFNAIAWRVKILFKRKSSVLGLIEYER